MLRLILTIVIGIIYCTGNAQGDSLRTNLIPNPSFEQANRCVQYNELCCPEAWRSTTLKLFYYLNNMNSQRATNQPIHGHRMISMCVHDERVPKNRAFAQVPLLCPLEEGVEYSISFYLKPTNANVGTLGARFQEQMTVSRNNSNYLGLQADVEFILPDTLQEDVWIKVEQTFVAKGDEKVMVFGNFTAEDSLNVRPFAEAEESQKLKFWQKKRENEDLRSRTYYMFDQFELSPLDPSIECNTEGQLERIYDSNVRHSIIKFTD
jgi:hypothetical protein